MLFFLLTLLRNKEVFLGDAAHQGRDLAALRLERRPGKIAGSARARCNAVRSRCYNRVTQKLPGIFYILGMLCEYKGSCACTRSLDNRRESR